MKLLRIATAIVIPFLMLGLASAQKPAEAPPPVIAREVPFTELEDIKIQNIQLRRALLQQQALKLDEEQNNFIHEMCSAAKIDQDRCEVNLEKKAKVERPKAPVTPAAASPKK